MNKRRGQYAFKVHGRKGHYYWNLLYTGSDGVTLMVATGVCTYTTKQKALTAIERIKTLATFARIEDIAP